MNNSHFDQDRKHSYFIELSLKLKRRQNSLKFNLEDVSGVVNLSKIL